MLPLKMNSVIAVGLGPLERLQSQLVVPYKPIVSLRNFRMHLTTRSPQTFVWPNRTKPTRVAQFVRSTALEVLNSSPSQSSVDEPYDEIYPPSRSADSLSSPDSIVQAGGGGMLRLVAAWDSLATLLPPDTGAGPAAELLLSALKLVLTETPAEGTTRAVSLASFLAELAGQGLPLDAEAIAAGVLAEAGGINGIPTSLVESRVGSGVARLLRDLRRVRALPSRVDLYDDAASLALRELALNFYSVKATAVEVAARLHSLRTATEGNTPSHDLHVAALEALQIYAPMGHALGMGVVSAELEDRCFRILFPTSYERTANWLKEETAANAETLEVCKAMLHDTVVSDPRFKELAGGLEVYGRTKTLFSTLKKLLRLGDIAKGGRSRSEIYDLLGIRAVVLPRLDVPADQAEEAAKQACYLVEEASIRLWDLVAGRRKDYIAAPKPNGYQSLHCTVFISSSSLDSVEFEDLKIEDLGDRGTTLELQIRTQAMHKLAESGEAAHAAYKGGLDAKQARQLRQWSDALLQRANLAAAAGADVEAITDTEAAEGLFRHLDLNGDGYLSPEELRQALVELGAGPGGARVADQLMKLADSNLDGAVSMPEFLEFQKRVGLCRAALAVDVATAGLLDEAAAEVGHSHNDYDGTIDITAAPAGDAGCQWMSMESDVDDAMFLAPPTSTPSGQGQPLRPANPQHQRLQGISNASENSRSSMHSWDTPDSTSSSTSNKNSSQRLGPVRSFLEGSGASVSSLDEPALSVSDSSSSSTSTSSEPSTSYRRSSPPANGHRKTNGTHGKNNGTHANSPNSTVNGVQPELLEKPERPKWAPNPSLTNGFFRLLRPGEAPAADAVWALQLISNESIPQLSVQDAAGQDLPPLPSPVQAFDAPPAEVSGFVVPSRGPCVLGAVQDRDCDVILDLPTISGRHLRLEVVPWRSSKEVVGGAGPGGDAAAAATMTSSRLILTDLGSTNGTWVNRARIVPHKYTPLLPGDVVYVAGPDIALQVCVLSAEAVKSLSMHSSSSLDDQDGSSLGPSVKAALGIAAALEAVAATRGIFSLAMEAGPRQLSEKAKELVIAMRYQEAYMMLLGGVMKYPTSGDLWAQLSNTERQRMRKKEPGSTAATTRAFFRAAVERFESDASQAVTKPAMSACANGLSRVFSSWAQLEFDLGSNDPARNLFERAVSAARAFPAGPAAGGAPKLLFTWAKREWKLGEAATAAKLCEDARKIDSKNAFVLTLLATIKVAAGERSLARNLFQKALKGDPNHVAAMMGWARLEASVSVPGAIRKARNLLRRALKVSPDNVIVLQSWAVAEAAAGNLDEARRLLQQCLDIDCDCIPALHAWGKLEDEAGNTEAGRALYARVLTLKPGSVETLSALGSLERKAGDMIAAQTHLAAALRIDPGHAPTLNELSLVAEAKGQAKEAYELKKRTQHINHEREASLSQVKRRARQAVTKKP